MALQSEALVALLRPHDSTTLCMLVRMRDVDNLCRVHELCAQQHPLTWTALSRWVSGWVREPAEEDQP